MQVIRAGWGKLIGVDMEPYRVELTGYCYRMLGSGFEAEDAVQETFVRAWKSYDESRASLRTWLYRIATNVCLDMLRSVQRRALAMDLGPASKPGGGMGAVVPDERWIHPVPDRLVLTEDTVVQRETIRLAFVAALQHLPPKQRAVLILRDVLCWSADEVAGLLETTVASVNSALQRSRATLRDRASNGGAPGEPWRPDEPVQRELLRRYCAAFERHDVDTLVSLLHEDATTSMPPLLWWFRGRDDIEQALRAPQASCEGARLVPVRANGSPAFWQTRPGPDGAHVPFALMIFDVRDGAVTGIVTYLGADRWLPVFPL